jgi:hypothetical protein
MARKVSTEPDTSTYQYQPMQSAAVLHNIGKITRVVFIGGMVFLIIINAQPWMQLAIKIVPTITAIPFIDSLVKIPFLGGWIQWGVREMTSILGLLLCGTIQIIEIMPMLIPNSKVLKNLRAAAYTIEFLVCFLRFPPYQGGTAAFLEDFLHWDAYLINWWNLVFFIVTMTGFEIAMKVAITMLQNMNQRTN